ncbi:PepSY domain-containing protein [Alkalibacillus sp. S2W]|uniref:PepSY domain-containing protein n=1 Tax=Alkalibacillus sp. S2W TaxID=3386553 RepID=UPI00398D672E
MRLRTGLWIVVGVMATGLLFLLAQSVIFSDETALLSKQDAENRLAEQVDGEMTFKSESSNDFIFEITREQGVYHATVSREDGAIIDLTREATIENDEEITNQSNQESQDSNQTEQNNGQNSSDSSNDQGSTQNDENNPDNEKENETETEDEPTRLSTDEVTNQINQEFEGEITSIELDDESDIYMLVIEHELTQTQLEVDALSGEIIARETEDTTPELAVTEEEATTIALEQVQGDGEVANVQLQEIEGIIYYIVTINATEEEQAIVEINGFSGDVETVTWTERNDTSSEEKENENNQNEEEESD